MCDPDNSLYREYLHYKALEADRGIVYSTTFEEWIELTAARHSINNQNSDDNAKL